MNPIDAIAQDIEKTNAQLAELRARLVSVRKEHEARIKEVDAMLAALPASRPVKAPTAPVSEKGPTIGQEIVDLAKSQPGIQTAGLVAALPHRSKKSVENTASRLVTEGKLLKEGKGHRAAA